MNIFSPSTFNRYSVNAYESICWLATTILVGSSIFVYLQNCDISRYSEQKFHSTPKDVYPSISICFGDILDIEKLRPRGINETSYWRFLKGNEANETFLEIDFDEVTIDLEYYLLAIEMYKEGYNHDPLDESYLLFNNIQHPDGRSQSPPKWKPKFYQDSTPFWGMIQKCLTLDTPMLPQQTLTWITMVMSKSVFQGGKRPGHPRVANNIFSVALHYHGQRYRFAQEKHHWDENEPQGEKLKSYGMIFRINEMAVIQQRSTRKNPCIENTIEEDETLKANIIGKMNCTPPYWAKSHAGNKSRCTAQDEIHEFYKFDIAKYVVPCRRLNHINYEYSETIDYYYDDLLQTESLKNHRIKHGNIIKNISLDSFYVSLGFTGEAYNEIFLTRQFDIQNLIGNAGGYIGMCVGYSLLQFRLLVANIISRINICRWSKKLY